MPGVVVHACNPEAEQDLEVEVSLGYISRLSLQVSFLKCLLCGMYSFISMHTKFGFMFS